MSRIVNLKIGCLNIGGNAKMKCESDDIIKLIKDHHIFMIQESWLSPDDVCPGVSSYSVFRTERKKHTRAKRHSGGIIVYFSNIVAGGLTKCKARTNRNSDAIWLKLDKRFFNFEKDVYLCCSYIIPNADDDTFEGLRKEIEEFSNNGTVCLIGDLNSRIGCIKENHYVLNTEKETDMLRPISVPSRTSMDKIVNVSGRKLLDILTNYDLLVANGRIMGDIEGNYTCCNWNGQSVNDMFIFHRDFLRKMNYFRVNSPGSWYSDHSNISISLRVNVTVKTQSNKAWKKLCKKIYSWNDESKSSYLNVLNNEEYIQKLHDFTNTHFDSINQATAEFTNIMNSVLSTTFPLKKRFDKKTVHRRDDFSPACQIAKRMFRKAQRRFGRDTNSVNRRHEYIIQKRNYRRAIYATKKIAKETKINKILELEQSDTKSFWRGIKSLISTRDDSVENIDKNDWSSHFHNVLNIPAAQGTDKAFMDYVTHSLPHLEKASALGNESMDYEISTEEINVAVKDLKMNKSVFTDGIGNEAIKYGFVHLKDALHHLFNIIFTSGEYPETWSEGLIIPIHKKGDKMDVNNYRGIIISSCVSKVLLRILNRRIENYMNVNRKWSIHQCGFKKDHRTEDNLFIINTIYQKYVNGLNQKVYIAFIDFSKFFDKINRDMLLYKLLKYNITGRMYNLIKSMYANTGYKIQVGENASPLFYGRNGLKQGCCMSPTLSSIYQNDLHEIFDNKNCDPIQLGNVSLNSISWADDLIVMSLSQDGFQKCLKKLEIYCNTWGLEINVTKTKAMVLSKRNIVCEPVYINGIPLEFVKSVNYLGFKISCNGNVQSLIKDRINKSSRVAHMVLQAIRTNRNVSGKLALSIFDKQIVPILLYGSAIWGVPQTHNSFYLEEQPEHLNTRSTVSNMLMSTLNRNVPFENARRVGRRSIDGATHRKILVKLKKYSDKQELFRLTSGGTFKISNFMETESVIEKVHHDFCKKSLNISKYSSNTAVQAELGRYPISNSAKSFAIKYWLRLHSGTGNALLNEAYNVCHQNEYEWLQGINTFLCENGFGNVWANPTSVNKDNFHKYFRQRLNDQHVQNWNSKLLMSNRFQTLKILHGEYKVENYIKRIKNPEIREIYTRLRTDMNILSTSKSQGYQQLELCPFCNDEPESVGHFLLKCDKYREVRSEFVNQISTHDVERHFESLNENEKLRYVLNVECPREITRICCSFVSRIYLQRVKDSVVLAEQSSERNAMLISSHHVNIDTP